MTTGAVLELRRLVVAVDSRLSWATDGRKDRSPVAGRPRPYGRSACAGAWRPELSEGL